MCDELTYGKMHDVDALLSNNNVQTYSASALTLDALRGVADLEGGWGSNYNIKFL